MVTGTLSLLTSSFCICCVFDYCGCWIDPVVDFSISSPRSFLHVQLFPYCCCSRCMSSLRPSTPRSPGSRPPQPARHGPDASAIPLEDSPGDAFSALGDAPSRALREIVQQPISFQVHWGRTRPGQCHTGPACAQCAGSTGLGGRGHSSAFALGLYISARQNRHPRCRASAGSPPGPLQVPSSLPFLSLPAWFRALQFSIPLPPPGLQVNHSRET